MGGRRQKRQMELAFREQPRSEALGSTRKGVEPAMAKDQPEHSASTNNQLMEVVCQQENMIRAYKRVKRNKGSPGVDGMTTDDLQEYVKAHWPQIMEQLLNGTYEPLPVKKVEIPKPDGSMRMLGVPTVMDRLIQQALLQVLQEEWDLGFSINSYGFRIGRSAHQAIGKAQEYIREGRQHVVDFDLEKFFDRVNHDILMGRVAQRIADKRVLKLIRRFLEAGMMTGGLVSPRVKGMPQGGPLSPLLSNLLLDELDKELERRGHRFCRYADDCNVYVSSQKAGERVMKSIALFLDKKLKLKVNPTKSAVAPVWERSFLGFTFSEHELAFRWVSRKSIKRFKDRIRHLTRRSGGKSLEATIKETSSYLQGWRSYYGYSQDKLMFRSLDGWIRRKVRCLIWKQWKHGKKRFRELRKKGLSVKQAATTAAASNCGPWKMSRHPLVQKAISDEYLASIGLLSLEVAR